MYHTVPFVLTFTDTRYIQSTETSKQQNLLNSTNTLKFNCVVVNLAAGGIKITLKQLILVGNLWQPTLEVVIFHDSG